MELCGVDGGRENPPGGIVYTVGAQTDGKLLRVEDDAEAETKGIGRVTLLLQHPGGDRQRKRQPRLHDFGQLILIDPIRSHAQSILLQYVAANREDLGLRRGITERAVEPALVAWQRVECQ